MSQDYDKVVEQWKNAIDGKHNYSDINGQAHFPQQFYDNMGRAIPVGSDEYNKRVELYKTKRGLI